jgi:hypothetical protein
MHIHNISTVTAEFKSKTSTYTCHGQIYPPMKILQVRQVDNSNNIATESKNNK